MPRQHLAVTSGCGNECPTACRSHWDFDCGDGCLFNIFEDEVWNFAVFVFKICAAELTPMVFLVAAVVGDSRLNMLTWQSKLQPTRQLQTS